MYFFYINNAHNTSISIAIKIKKLFKFLEKVVLNHNTSNNNSSIFTSLRARIGGIAALLLFPNISLATKFHAERAINLQHEENMLATVVKKLDKDQPLPSGISRWASIQEYIGELRADRFNSEKFAYRNHYRDVVMKELFNDTSSVISDVSSVVSSIF